MKFDVKKDGNLTILTIKEKKIDTSVSAELKAEFLILCKPKNSEVLVVDMKAVEFCDSSGLSALLIAHRTMNEHKGEVRFANVNKSILNLLKISQLDRLFRIYGTVKQAIKG
ncbi:MAG: STAS domain-containing protein [Bacteroidetes bacterium]|jgi:anti-anti-sigma factor|nr:STAS domain-containing protein [Bacteroidota bacterium]MBU1422137.1 STAS domain-containing protein [Bacteroidota bacterium]MBU2637325.1 STAS domain-containing protein [Bacteroidota bacterium]MDI6779791.1 STAS domain-containing protein [Bacteroidota bacterium]